MTAWWQGWDGEGERVALCRTAAGGTWAFYCDLSKAGTYEGAWTAQSVGPAVGEPPASNDVPDEVREWVWETQI